MRSKAFKIGVAVFLVFLIGAYAFFFLRNMNRASFADGVLTVKGVRYEMAAIPAGKFVMGSQTDLGQGQPGRRVRLGAFWLGKTEVSHRLWRAVTGHVFLQMHRGDEDPVQDVSRDDCRAFIDRLNEISGARFRLPSVTEREYASRAARIGSGSSRGLRLAADRVPGKRP
jgi:hypothetical protein